MSAAATSYTVICKFHAGIDACDPWSEFAVVVDGVDDPQGAAAAACDCLIRENGGKAEASIVIAGAPVLHVPNCEVFDSEEEQCDLQVAGRVISYRELN